MFIYFIIFGLGFILLDWVFGKSLKQENPIHSIMEDFILRLSRESVLLSVLITFGGLVGSAFIATQFPENSIGFWVFTIITAIMAGYIGKTWIQS